MASYIIRRLLMGLVVVWVVTLFIFLIMRLLPGDPLILFLGAGDLGVITDEQLAELRHLYHLDLPLVTQYFMWLGRLLRGDLGYSILTQLPINTLVAQRLPITLSLSFFALIISSILGITFGTICALNRGKWPDTLFSVIANLGITLPVFWVGILLVYLLCLRLDLLPAFGYTSPLKDFWLHIRQLIMPVFCLTVFPVASLTRQTRSSMLEVIRQDYIRTAWAKGLAQRIVITRHMIKNALIPVVTQIGLTVPFLVGGAVLVEQVFSIPGMGRMITDAVTGSDYQVVQSGVVVIALTIVVANIIVDIVYAWLDPRIRLN